MHQLSNIHIQIGRSNKLFTSFNLFLLLFLHHFFLDLVDLGEIAGILSKEDYFYPVHDFHQGHGHDNQCISHQECSKIIVQLILHFKYSHNDPHSPQVDKVGPMLKRAVRLHKYQYDGDDTKYNLDSHDQLIDMREHSNFIHSSRSKPKHKHIDLAHF